LFSGRQRLKISGIYQSYFNYNSSVPTVIQGANRLALDHYMVTRSCWACASMHNL